MARNTSCNPTKIWFIFLIPQKSPVIKNTTEIIGKSMAENHWMLTHFFGPQKNDFCWLKKNHLSHYEPMSFNYPVLLVNQPAYFADPAL